MATTDRQTTGFLESLATWIAARAGGGTVVIYEPGVGETRNLFVHHMPDAVDAIVSSLHLTAPSPTSVDGIETFDVEVQTRGIDAVDIAAAKERHELITGSFFDATFGGVPVRRFDLDDEWFVFCADPQAIAQLEFDGQDRPIVKSTVKIRAALKPAA